MTKELLTRGCQLSDIHDQQWRNKLTPTQIELVDQVSSQLERFVDQGNDQPTTSDNLGRDDYAHGLAALFLNPYLKSPIAVGISGSWGMGKSSLMIQTEVILLQTSAQLSLLPSSKFSNSASDIPGAKTMELSEKGQMKHREIKRQLDLLSDEQMQAKNQNEDSLDKFLDKYDVKYHDIFKSLAVMDKSDMFKQNGQPSNSKGDFPTEESVPAILTVQYNAWKYRNESEALAGMAVEITKEIEGTMTRAQWLSTCWRNTWNKKKYAIFVDIIFPCLLTIALASSIACIVWVMLDRYKLKEWAKVKYACLPAALVITGWTLTKSVMGIIKPVSSQLMNYMSFPDHADKLGYQERVISDIKFLKEEMGKQPHGAFTTFLMLWKWTTSLFTTILMLWQWITLSILNPARSKRDTRIVEVATEIAKVAPASPTSLTRIIVFVDDLDRCNESVILQVLSAINLVLAVCEINVILGMDKDLIERAIIKKYGDAKGKKSSKHNKELADMYIQKIIQLPLDLADPSKEESRRFLKGQLGVFETDSRTSRGSIPHAEIESESEKEINPVPDVTVEETPEEINSVIETESEKEINPSPDVAIEMQNTEEPTTQAPTETDPAVSLVIPTGAEATQGNYSNRGTSDEPTANTNRGIKSSVSFIPIRDILFVTYSEGEQDAFCYFQEMATECRKLPREWKRLLNYHRLVWYIFLISNQAKVLAAGWQVHLIAWIFVCCEWKDNMNILIKNWSEIGLPNINSDSGGPSLLLIVEHLMEEHDQKADHPNRKDETSEKIQEVEGSVGKTGNIKETAPSSINEAQKLKDADADMMARIPKLEPEMATSTDGSDGKETSRELKKEMKELRDQVDQVSPELKEFRDQVSLELKELKEHMVKKQTEKIKKKAEDKKIKMEKIKKWKRMKTALERYDVPMEFIQAFQRFRFYCIAGYLPRPQRKNADL